MKVLVLLVMCLWQVNCQYQTRIPTQGEYNEVRNYFLNQFDNGNRAWVAKLLRLAFHDSSTYVDVKHHSDDAAQRKIGGGTHLCMWENSTRGVTDRTSFEFTDGDNNNLQTWINNLQEAFNMFGVGGSSNFELSRADIAQIGAAAGIQYGSDSEHDTRTGVNPPLVLLKMNVKVGRKDCEDVDTIAFPVPAPYDGGLMDGAPGGLTGVEHGRLPLGELFSGTDGPIAFENFSSDGNQADTTEQFGPVSCGSAPTDTCGCGLMCWDELLQHMRGWISRQGFGPSVATQDEAIVALLGAHTYGGVHLEDSGHNTGTWTGDSLVFDSGYYKSLRDLGWTMRKSVESGNILHTADNGERIMLIADLNVNFQSSMNSHADLFKNEAVWIPKFKKYYNQMIEHGHPGISFPTCQITGVNGFTVRYSLDDRDPLNEQVTIIIELNTVIDRWFAAGFSPVAAQGTSASMDGADVVVHNRNDSFTEQRLGAGSFGAARDTSDLIYAEFWTMDGKSVLQITRPLVATGNGQTINKESANIIMAYSADGDDGNTPISTQHGNLHRLSVTVNLTQVNCVCTSNDECNDSVDCTLDTCDIGSPNACKHTLVHANCTGSPCAPTLCTLDGCQRQPDPCPTTCTADEITAPTCAPAPPGPPSPPDPHECSGTTPVPCNDNRVCTDDTCGAAGTGFANQCRFTNDHGNCSVVGEMCDGLGNNPDPSGCADDFFEWQFGIANDSVPQITVLAGGAPARFVWDQRINGRDHTVIELSQTEMENCTTEATVMGPTRRGTTLASMGFEEAINFTSGQIGEHFYSCQVLWPTHCEDHNMKAKVLVLENWGCGAVNDTCYSPTCVEGVCVKANDGILNSDALGCDIFSGSPPQDPCSGPNTPICVALTGCVACTLPQNCNEPDGDGTTCVSNECGCTHGGSCTGNNCTCNSCSTAGDCSESDGDATLCNSGVCECENGGTGCTSTTCDCNACNDPNDCLETDGHATTCTSDVCGCENGGTGCTGTTCVCNECDDPADCLDVDSDPTTCNGGVCGCEVSGTCTGTVCTCDPAPTHTPAPTPILTAAPTPVCTTNTDCVGAHSECWNSHCRCTDSGSCTLNSCDCNPPGGASGDPIIYSFDGGWFHFMGINDTVFNLISDRHFVLNSRFFEDEFVRAGMTWMGDVSLRVGEDVIYYNLKGQAEMNKERLVPQIKYLKDGGKLTLWNNGMALEIPNYEIFLTVLPNPPHMNVHVDYIWSDAPIPHGVLGQTADMKIRLQDPGDPDIARDYIAHNATICTGWQGEGCVEGTMEDYMIKDNNLFGVDFTFSKFVAASERFEANGDGPFEHTKPHEYKGHLIAGMDEFDRARGGVGTNEPRVMEEL